MKRALIFASEGRRNGGSDREDRRNYVIQRGYEVIAVFRKWKHAQEFIDRGEANIVVFPAQVVDSDPGRKTVNLIDHLGGDTVPLGPAAGATTPMPSGLGERTAARIEGYRDGYGDGYLDCATIKAMHP